MCILFRADTWVRPYKKIIVFFASSVLKSFPPFSPLPLFPASPYFYFPSIPMKLTNPSTSSVMASRSRWAMMSPGAW
jgi:hypothetical protein